MKQAKVLSDKQLKAVLVICESMQNGSRNRLAVLLSHYAGLRAGEIATLNWGDVLDQNHVPKEIFYLEAANTKSKEARQVHLNVLLRKELGLYWQGLDEHRSLDWPIIESQRGGFFTANTLCQLFGTIYNTAGIDDATSHSGRRWFITQLAHKGVSPKVIMELAGHKHLGTTQRYIDVNDEMKSQAVGLL